MKKLAYAGMVAALGCVGLGVGLLLPSDMSDKDFLWVAAEVFVFSFVASTCFRRWWP